jgi:hypothetical protein
MPSNPKPPSCHGLTCVAEATLLHLSRHALLIGDSGSCQSCLSTAGSNCDSINRSCLPSIAYVLMFSVSSLLRNANCQNFSVSSLLRNANCQYFSVSSLLRNANCQYFSVSSLTNANCQNISKTLTVPSTGHEYHLC